MQQLHLSRSRPALNRATLWHVLTVWPANAHRVRPRRQHSEHPAARCGRRLTFTVPRSHGAIVRVTVLTLQGRELLSRSPSTPACRVALNVASLPAATYVVKATTRKRTVRQVLAVTRQFRHARILCGCSGGGCGEWPCRSRHAVSDELYSRGVVRACVNRPQKTELLEKRPVHVGRPPCDPDATTRAAESKPGRAACSVAVDRQNHISKRAPAGAFCPDSATAPNRSLSFLESFRGNENLTTFSDATPAPPLNALICGAFR